MADKLTPQQAQAVKDRGGVLLVSAAAGSGKTKVLVDRLMEYLRDPMDPADLDSFLIITYTKAAASELRGKIASKLTEIIAHEPENKHLQKQMQRLFLTKISTVHGFCADLLREYAYRLDLAADFRVADDNECRELRERVLTDLLERAYLEGKPEFLAFVDSQGLGRDDRLVPQLIEKVYDSARCHLDPEQWLEDCLKASQTQDMTDAGDTPWGKYLIDDLHSCVNAHFEVLTKCVREMERSGNLEKPIANFRETLAGLEELRTAQTWDEIHKLGSIPFRRLVFPRKNMDTELIERVKAARDACKKAMEGKLHSFTDHSAQVLKDLRQSQAGATGLIDLVRQFQQDYQAAKRSRRVLDFSDLEHKTLDLLLGKSRSHPTVAAVEIGRRYREILVDEYQDSNGVQDAIFSALTGERNNCFLVGDVKQSIYQFRLADPGIFLEKYQSFAPAEEAAPKQGRKVLLSHNFRSGGEVIEAVNDVFSTCMRPEVGGLSYTQAEALREGIPHEPLPDPAVELYAIDTRHQGYAEEAGFVADRIHQMLKQGTLIRSAEGLRPVTAEDIVILLRSPGSAASYFQNALQERGIRVTTGGSSDLLQAPEIHVLRALLQTVVNPRLDIPLIAALASPVFAFTADDLAAFRSHQKKGSVYDALCISDLPKAKDFLSVLTRLRQEAKRNTVTGLLEQCFRLTRLDSIYSAMPDGEARQAHLQAFFRIAADFEKGSLRDLGQFLEHLEALEESGIPFSPGSASGCVTIMSIHKSKGLEFPVVFLSNLSRSFNQESVRAQVLCDRTLGLGLSVADTQNRVRYPTIAKRAIAVKMVEESVSEELRVLYVAMTRARDRLVMTYALKHPEKDLADIARRYDFDQGELLCRGAICLGDWVMLGAMLHTEAGQLHAIAGKPLNTHMGSYPWHIQLVGEVSAQQNGLSVREEASSMPRDAALLLKAAMEYHYPFPAATRAPSKQTATGRKGRFKDAEAAEHTHTTQRYPHSWRKPSFAGTQPDARAYGNALHAAMQYICYENCASPQQVRQELVRLTEQGFLTREQAEQVDVERIACFFATPIGQKLRTGTPHIREFKFSLLDDGKHYLPELTEEQVLLQGVVDCALLEEDGITILDFKTDRVSEGTLAESVSRYRLQIQTYSEALSRIYEMPVKAQYLYYFRLNRFVEVK